MTTPYREADPLGALVSEHRISRAQQGIRIGVGIFCGVVTVDCIAIPTVVWGESRPRTLLDVAIFGGATVIFGALTFSAFSHFWRSRGQRVEVREGGLRIEGGAQSKDVRWTDIASIGGLAWEALEDATPHLTPLWLDDFSGERHRLPAHVHNPYELGREIQARTFEKRLEAVEQELSSGKTVHFGQCSLDSTRVWLGNESPLPRSEIKSVRISSRWIEVRPKRGGKRIVPTEEVPNTDVLLALLHPRSERGA